MDVGISLMLWARIFSEVVQGTQAHTQKRTQSMDWVGLGWVGEEV